MKPRCYSMMSIRACDHPHIRYVGRWELSKEKAHSYWGGNRRAAEHLLPVLRSYLI